MAFGELALKGVTTVLYAIAFCCSMIALGIYGYFMAALDRNNLHIAPWIRAVTGLAGATALYTLLAVLLTCCLGGLSGFAWLGILLDIIFFGAFIAIAIMARDGSKSCNGFVRTPVGNGYSDADAPGVSDYHYACTLNKVTFAVALIGAGVLLLFAAPFQVWLMRHRKRSHRVSGTSRSWNPMNRNKQAPVAPTYDTTPTTQPAGYHNAVGTGKDF